MKRINVAEAFIQELHGQVKDLIRKKEDEIKISEKKEKQLRKKLEIIDADIKNVEKRIVDAASGAAGSVLNDAMHEKQAKLQLRTAALKHSEEAGEKLEQLNKGKTQLKGLEKELKEVDRYAVYWAVGMGERANCFERADAIEKAISSDLSDRKVGLFNHKSIEPSVIKTYAEEVGDLILGRLEYIERLDQSDRPARGASVEGLVVQAAMEKFNSSQMDSVAASSGFSRFEYSLHQSLVNALESASLEAAECLQ